MNEINLAVPLPFDFKKIDRLYELNKKFKKSRVKILYTSMPDECLDYIGFERKTENVGYIYTIEDFIKYVKYAISKGFEVRYCLECSDGLGPHLLSSAMYGFKQAIDWLLKAGISAFYVADTQILTYFNVEYPELKTIISPYQEYYTIKQYMNLFESYDFIEGVGLPYNLNKNIDFIKNISEGYRKKVEIIANSGCLKGCPFRISHNLLISQKSCDNYKSTNNKFCDFFEDFCKKEYYNNFFENLCKSNVIYPWNIKKYSEITGVDTFRLVGYNYSDRTIFDFTCIEKWMAGIENIELIFEEYLISFNSYLSANGDGGRHIKVKEIYDLLPDCNYFMENGKNCNNICGLKCKKCEMMSEKIKERFGDKNE